jgi:hypothetical protein
MSTKLAFALGITIISFTVNATPLTVVNHTKSDSTSRIHNWLNKCSSDLLGADGVTPAGQTKEISETNIKLACYFTPDDCVADVYASNNCSGESIALMSFSIKDGMKWVVEKMPNKYKINAPSKGFYVEINQVA